MILFHLFENFVHRNEHYRENHRVCCELDSVKDDSAKIVDAEAIEKSIEVAHKKSDVDQRREYSEEKR